MQGEAYPERVRIDALEKVRGRATFGADETRPNMAHGVFAVATIGKGSIRTIDTKAAEAAPGVRLVLTHLDMDGIESSGFVLAGGSAFQSFLPMSSTLIAYRGQPIALVVADTYETAYEAASLISATYVAEPPSVTLDAPGVEIINQAESPLPKPMFDDLIAGNADAAYADAPVKVEIECETPPQHQNPIELIATVAEWRDGTLIIHEGTQNTAAIRAGLARQLRLPPERVQVISPYAGGGFGQKNSLQMQTLFAAIASQRLGRPVKIVVPRSQIFHDASFRPASRHRLRLGANRDGRLVAAIHEIDAQTSRHDLFPGQYADMTARLHGIANFRGHQRLVRTDVQTPGYMRPPFEHVAAFPMETAVDMLSDRLQMDPVALRLANDTDRDPIENLPLSSRHLAECLRRGAEMFGWSRRSPKPGSMRLQNGTLIGWGVACGAYPYMAAAAITQLTAFADGRISLNVPGHEMGQGIRTALTNALAERLGVSLERIHLVIGDTRGVPQHLTAGSWGTSTAVPAALDAVDELRAALSRAADGDASGDPAEILRRLRKDSLTVETRTKAPGQSDEAFKGLAAGGVALQGPVLGEGSARFTTYSYSAHFVEVHVEPTTRRIRVPRVVSVVDCGRVVSPRTARSQIRGAVVWGIGGSLRERSEVDPRFGGFINSEIAEYLIPVNADIGEIEVSLIDKPDPRANRAGVKGLGEIAMVGVAPAIGNAIFHATGKRLTSLPFRIEHVLES
jgi:xanthine dehydrogenase YagR molybdenum-binding subunit